MTFWEKVGESVGYGLGAVFFGPKFVAVRRARRERRRAFAHWLSGETYTKQTEIPGRVRRLVERQEDELSFSLECELSPRSGMATIGITPEHLPERVVTRIEPGPEFFGTTLEAEVNEGIFAAAVGSPLGTITWQRIDIAPDRILLVANAPSAADEWESFARGALAVAVWLTRRFQAGGYR